MKTNAELKANVQNTFKNKPLLNSLKISITTKGSVISITGNVDSYGQKKEVERISKFGLGIHHVKNELVVADYNPLLN